MQTGREISGGVIEVLDRIGLVALALAAAALIAALWHTGTALEVRAWALFHAALWGAVGAFCVARGLDIAGVLRKAPAAIESQQAAGPDPGGARGGEPGLHRAA